MWKFDGEYWTWMFGSFNVNDIGHYGTKGVASSLNVPSSRTEATAWRDSSDILWLFGGFGFPGFGKKVLDIR